MSDTGIAEKSTRTHVNCVKGVLAASLGLWMIMLWLIPVKAIVFLLAVLFTAMVIAALIPIIAHAWQDNTWVRLFE